MALCFLERDFGFALTLRIAKDSFAPSLPEPRGFCITVVWLSENKCTKRWAKGNSSMRHCSHYLLSIQVFCLTCLSHSSIAALDSSHVKNLGQRWKNETNRLSKRPGYSRGNGYNVSCYCSLLPISSYTCFRSARP